MKPVKVFRRSLTIEDVPGEMLHYLNFEGRNDQRNFNPNHERSFDIEIPEADARLLYDLGWRVKVKGIDPDTKQRAKHPKFDDELENKTYHVTVKVSFKYPTNVWRIVEGSNKKRRLMPDAADESRDVKILDKDNIISADVDVRGSLSRNDNIISLYLETAHFVVAAGRSSDKWSNMEIDDEDVEPIEEEYDGEVPFK